MWVRDDDRSYLGHLGLGASRLHPKSGNEFDQLALATERLRLSINMAIQRLTKKS